MQKSLENSGKKNLWEKTLEGVRGFTFPGIFREDQRGKYNSSPVLEKVTFLSGSEVVSKQLSLITPPVLAEGFTAILYILRNRVTPWIRLS